MSAPVVKIILLYLALLFCLLSKSCTKATGPTCLVSEHDACNTNNGTHGAPSSKNRVCSVTDPRNDYNSWESKECDDRNYINSVCPGFVGMNLTYKCQFPGAQLHLYKDGVSLNGSSVNYGYLLPKHAGVYECRNGSNHTLNVQNLTVNEDVRIGGPGSRCFAYNLNCSEKCCQWTSQWWVPREDYANFKLLVYSENVTVSVDLVEWLVDRETRSEVDPGFSVRQDMMDPVIWYINVAKNPVKLTEHYPYVKFRVTARNAFSSHSVCISTLFIGPAGAVIVENETLPQSTEVSEGQEAAFQCKISISKTSQEVDLFYFEFEFREYTAAENEKSFTSSKVTYYPAKKQSCTNYTCVTGDCPFSFNKRDLDINQQSSVLLFDVRIPHVTLDLNGSSFSCSIVYTNGPVTLLQWKKVATLTVLENTSTYSGSTKNLIVCVSAVSLLAVVLLVAVIMTAVIAIWRKRTLYRQVPLYKGDVQIWNELS